MMRLKVEELKEGLHPSEVIVSVKTETGAERLVVSRRSLDRDRLTVGWPLATKEGRVLVELPRETQSGAWRVWVDEDQLESDERMRA